MGAHELVGHAGDVSPGGGSTHPVDALLGGELVALGGGVGLGVGGLAVEAVLVLLTLHALVGADANLDVVDGVEVLVVVLDGGGGGVLDADGTLDGEGVLGGVGSSVSDDSGLLALAVANATVAAGEGVLLEAGDLAAGLEEGKAAVLVLHDHAEEGLVVVLESGGVSLVGGVHLEAVVLVALVSGVLLVVGGLDGGGGVLHGHEVVLGGDEGLARGEVDAGVLGVVADRGEGELSVVPPLHVAAVGGALEVLGPGVGTNEVAEGADLGNLGDVSGAVNEDSGGGLGAVVLALVKLLLTELNVEVLAALGGESGGGGVNNGENVSDSLGVVALGVRGVVLEDVLGAVVGSLVALVLGEVLDVLAVAAAGDVLVEVSTLNVDELDSGGHISGAANVVEGLGDGESAGSGVGAELAGLVVVKSFVGMGIHVLVGVGKHSGVLGAVEAGARQIEGDLGRGGGGAEREGHEDAGGAEHGAMLRWSC